MECEFGKSRNKEKGVVTLEDQEIPKSESYWSLGLLIKNWSLGSTDHKDGEIEQDVNHKIRARWMKWRSASKVLCYCRIPIK